jgi:hypothetical protein
MISTITTYTTAAERIVVVGCDAVRRTNNGSQVHKRKRVPKKKKKKREVGEKDKKNLM